MPGKYFKKKGNKRSGGGPFTMKGYTYPGTAPTKKTTMTPEVTVSGGKGGKSVSQRQYEESLDKKASQLYMGDRGTRAGGTDFATADEKTKAQYRAKAQKGS